MPKSPKGVTPTYSPYSDCDFFWGPTWKLKAVGLTRRPAQEVNASITPHTMK